MGHSEHDPAFKDRRPWNAGRNLGAKRALKPQQVWAIRFWLDGARRARDRALFDLAIDSKLRGCDIVELRIGDIVSGGRVRARATRDLAVAVDPQRKVHYGQTTRTATTPSSCSRKQCLTLTWQTYAKTACPTCSWAPPDGISPRPWMHWARHSAS